MPNGAYRPVASPTSNSAKTLDHRVLGMPHATMAAIVLSTLPARDTPLHLKDQNPPIDFTSHLRPPNKIGSSQILVQVYATAIDETDVRALDDKGRAEIGKWVPGRSFVGRCMTAGADEKEIVRGEIVIGIMDVRKVSSSWSLRAIDFA
jgi:threonine dehydrogenase-like Zn-dependent dehydrogenase